MRMFCNTKLDVFLLLTLFQEELKQLWPCSLRIKAIDCSGYASIEGPVLYDMVKITNNTTSISRVLDYIQLG